MKKRSKAQQYNDKILDTIIVESEKVFGKAISCAEAMKLYNLANKNIGLVLIALFRIQEYQQRSGEVVKSIWGMYKTQIKRNGNWPDVDQDRVKSINREFDNKTSKLNSMGSILKKIAKE